MTKLSSDQRNKLNDSDFGIPEERMYPLHDKAHVESAAKLFGHADAKYKKSLARKILRRAKDFNIDTSGWSEVLKYAQEQVPPMSDGTSLGNASPSTFAAYNEEDELVSRADQLAGNVDIEMTVELAREIAYKIHEQTKRDAKPPVGNQNCQLCTWCAEAQFRGMDVLPRPVYSPRDPVLGIPGETIVLHPIKLPIRNNDDAVTRVKEAGHGARYYVHVNWKGSEGGHEFLLINIAFQVYLMDAQQGVVENVDENERYFDDTNFANSYMARLDDHHLNSYLLKDATDPSKTLPWDSAKDIPYMRENGLLGEDEEIPEDGAVQEAACNASLLNVKNQLMNKLSGEFEFIGGSLVPKFTMKSNEKPDVAFEVNVNGQSIEVTPVINGIPDLLHKRRGIAIMCAANTIAEFARETVKNYKPVQEGALPLGSKSFDENLLRQSAQMLRAYKIKDHIWKYGPETRKERPLPENVRVSLFHLVDNILDAKDFQTYDHYRRLLCEILDMPTDRIIEGSHLTYMSQGDLRIQMKPDSEHRVLNNGPNVKLYHTSARSGLTELKPTFMSVSGKLIKRVEALYPTPRVYFGYNSICLRQGAASSIDDSTYAYLADPNDIRGKTIKGDTELNGTNACFVETETPIRVTDVTSQFRKGGTAVQESFMDEYEKEDPRFVRVMVPSEEAIPYMKEDPELSQYWEELNKSTQGVILVDRKTKKQIGHVFVHTNKKDKGFIFNLEVKPEYRRQGFGWILTDDAVRRLGGEDLTVDADNEPAIKLYTKYGFTVYKKGQWHYDPPKDELWMKFDRSKLKPIQEGASNRDDTLIPVKDFQYDTVYRGAMGKFHSDPLFVTPFKGIACIFVARDAVKQELRKRGLHSYNLGYNEWKTATSNTDEEITTVHVKVRSEEGKTFEPFEIDGSGNLYTYDVSKLKDNIYRYGWMNPKLEFLVANCKTPPVVNSEQIKVHYIVEPEQVPVQEGAFQDIKNGVNPFSDDLVFHVSPDKHLDGQVWQPRVPDYLDPYNPDDTGFEDNTTPRICFSTSIEGALNGITVNIQRQSPDTFDKMYVYVPEKPWKKYKHKTNKELVDSKLVYDANVTREVWIMEPVRMKLYGVIRVDQVSDAKRKAVVPTASGQKDTRNYYTYKWHWVVKPKALEKATKFDYSPERVISDLCVDLKKFKYGLIKDGRLMTGNVSEEDYDKYWVFHTGQEVDEAGGGNCYDMVEYEAGYLEAFGVSYKKYFMSSTRPGDETPETHTFVVVPLDGKFIYIEQAFKRVIDEWGDERQKSFDKLNDLFDYVAECSTDFYGSDLNFGVWDYTDEQFTPGTPMHDFQNWIYKNCKMVYDGEAKQSAVKSEMDTFITIGDSMFYVSEYHNALFDDPDAHEEAICEFGLLLDSPDDEYFEETEKPYDDYLKKHGYDPKTNTILTPDPNDWSVSGGRKMIRVSAGRIGSKKERNRLNKFLRENGYDPETETIQTDINDRKNPGRKKRVKFEINPSNDGEMEAQWNEDEKAFVNEKITMPPKSLQKKPYRSNQIFKHEEGHAAQYGDTARPARSFFGIALDDPEFVPNGEATKGVDKAKQHLSSMSDEDKSKIRVSHDLDPTEYHADAYGELHNRYSKRGNSSRRELMNAADEFEKKLNEMDRSIIKKGKQEARKKYREDETVLRKLLSLPGYPGTDVSDENWAKFLIANKKYIPKDKWPSIEGYLKYREQTDKLRDKVRELQKKARAAGMDPDSDEWDDFYFENIKPIHDEIKKIRDQADGALDGSSYVFSTKDLAKEAEKRGIDNLFSEKIGRSAQEYIDYKKKEKAGVKYRDPDEMRFAHQKRGEYAQQVWDERDKQQKAQAAKQRQLSKEQLQQQIASGKLTKDQAAKAERKIQKIEAYEKQQAEYGPNAQPKPVKKKPAAKQDTIAVANQSLTTPASKEEKGAKSQSQSTTKKEG